MPDLNASLWAATYLSDLLGLDSPLAYVLGPGPEFIPYFLALLGVIGAALIAVIQWPISVLLGWLKGKRSRRENAEPPAAVESRASRDVGYEQSP